MEASILVQLTALIVLGIGACWLAARLHLPSILLLLLFGFAAGPLTGFIEPDRLFGEMLFPFVSLAVAVILFEGGMNLKLNEIRDTEDAVIRLVVIGAIVTFGLTTLAAHYILHYSWILSMLLGSILIVTGPTVIMPLMQFIRPNARVNALTKWEGIVNDPVGAILAVFIFEIALGQATGHHIGAVFLIKAAAVGSIGGLLGAWILVAILRHHLAPDYLINAIALMLVLLIFTASNVLVHESGLLSVTLMGIILANQKKASVHHILMFKEELRVLLIAILFIALSARLDISTLKLLGIEAVIFVAVMILVVRPVTIWLATLGTGLPRNEKVFLAWMAPRGIVAAAVTSVFAIELHEAGLTEADTMLPIVFLLIVATVLIYGLTAGPLARANGVASANSQGLLIVGAQSWAQEWALLLQERGVRVLLIDTNRENVHEAKLAGLESRNLSILSEEGFEKLNLSGIKAMLALTPNDEVNALAALRCSHVFGRSNTYQLAAKHREHHRLESVSQDYHARTIGMHDEQTYTEISDRVHNQFSFKMTLLTEQFGYEEFITAKGEGCLPVCALSADGELRILTPDAEPPISGEEVLALAAT